MLALVQDLKSKAMNARGGAAWVGGNEFATDESVRLADRTGIATPKAFGGVTNELGCKLR